MNQERVSSVCDSIVRETEKVMVGKSQEIRLLLAAMLADGHVLLEDMPGVGKTTLIKTMSRALGFDFRRIQFTPDLLPSDVVGVNIFDRNTGAFVYKEGPVFTHILLADEINRAIPRTQSALLESMEERQVTIDGESRKLPAPFFVLATENPVESESTFQLPAAQMDRFLVQMSLGYPTGDEEIQVLKNVGKGIPFEDIQAVTGVEEFREMQKYTENIHVSQELLSYMVAIVQATRENDKLKYGASPRASLALLKLTKAMAAMEGKDYVTPDHVKAAAVSVLRHRIQLNSNARLTGTGAEDVIDEILSSLPAPTDAMMKTGE